MCRWSSDRGALPLTDPKSGCWATSSPSRWRCARAPTSPRFSSNAPRRSRRDSTQGAAPSLAPSASASATLPSPASSTSSQTPARTAASRTEAIRGRTSRSSSRCMRARWTVRVRRRSSTSSAGGSTARTSARSGASCGLRPPSLAASSFGAGLSHRRQAAASGQGAGPSPRRICMPRRPTRGCRAVLKPQGPCRSCRAWVPRSSPRKRSDPSRGTSSPGTRPRSRQSRRHCFSRCSDRTCTSASPARHAPSLPPTARGLCSLRVPRGRGKPQALASSPPRHRCLSSMSHWRPSSASTTARARGSLRRSSRRRKPSGAASSSSTKSIPSRPLGGLTCTRRPGGRSVCC
mmetsp:Transcript_739/g.1754  ORF Transcript_739/g.1754 Transcript_739/m.1754 type:complete len:348 (+) Transcript_739:622-1665(+)